MTNKTIFSIDGKSIKDLFGNLFGSIRRTRVVATSSSNKELANLPLLFVLIVGILFPVATVAAIIVVLALSIKVSLQKQVENEIKLLEV